MICPLHGPVWRKDLGYILDKYAKWAAYEPEVQGVLIAFASVYGGTETAANILACRLAELGIPVDLYDVSVTHYSYVLSEAFKYSHLVFASSTLQQRHLRLHGQFPPGSGPPRPPAAARWLSSRTAPGPLPAASSCRRSCAA